MKNRVLSAAMATVEFFFDCSSPWTYYAFRRVPPACARAGATLYFGNDRLPLIEARLRDRR